MPTDRRSIGQVLKILAEDRPKLDILFSGKTPLHALAFGNP